VFRAYFARLGLELDGFLQPVPLAPLCAYEFADGTRLHSHSDRARFAAELETTGSGHRR
jgi:hypothetical protein